MPINISRRGFIKRTSALAGGLTLGAMSSPVLGRVATESPGLAAGVSSPKKWFSLLAVVLGLLLASSASHGEAGDGEVRSLTSPDGRIHVTIRWPAPGSAERPLWS